jgi:molecular chaperone GrpE
MDEQVENMEEITQDTMADQNEEKESPESEAQDPIQAELDALRAEAQKNLDGWQRSLADFTNYKRRTSKELAEARDRGALDALGQVLPVLDDFERAIDSIPEDLQDNPWISGASLILKKMQKVMDEYKVTVIDPVGEEFDPNFHEAIGTDDSGEYESGIVTTTLQKGYRSGERVLRPALVRVAT